jgi:hypothetical protein
MDTVAPVSNSTQRVIVDEAHIEGGAKLLRDAAKKGSEEILALLGGLQEELKQSSLHSNLFRSGLRQFIVIWSIF